MSTTTTNTAPETRPPVPPFTYEDAVKKVRMAENAWNTRDPHKVKCRMPDCSCVFVGGALFCLTRGNFDSLLSWFS